MQRVVLIKTCHKHRDRLDAVQLTWATDLRRSGVPVYWVEGGYLYTTSSRHPMGGRIGACCSDDRVGLTDKVREGLAEILSRNAACDYVFVADDDTFVHTERWLRHSPTGELECRKHSPVTNLDRKVNKSKPYVTGGPGWHMSRRMCELYIEQAHMFGHSNDDVIVARVAAHNGVPITHRPDLYGADRYTDKQDRVRADNNLITCHDISPREMQELHDAFNFVVQRTKGTTTTGARAVPIVESGSVQRTGTSSIG